MQIIDELRTFVIIFKHSEKPKTIRPSLIEGAVYTILKEAYDDNPTTRAEVLTIEIEKSEGHSYHLYPSGIYLMPRVQDGKEYMLNHPIKDKK